jgi:hypothetical protein
VKVKNGKGFGEVIQLNPEVAINANMVVVGMVYACLESAEKPTSMELLRPRFDAFQL